MHSITTNQKMRKCGSADCCFVYLFVGLFVPVWLFWVSTGYCRSHMWGDVRFVCRCIRDWPECDRKLAVKSQVLRGSFWSRHTRMRKRTKFSFTSCVVDCREKWAERTETMFSHNFENIIFPGHILQIEIRISAWKRLERKKSCHQSFLANNRSSSKILLM